MTRIRMAPAAAVTLTSFVAMARRAAPAAPPAPAAPAQGAGRGQAPLLVTNPHYVSIHMQIDVNAPVDRVWARVGKYCDIGEWGGFNGCTILSGTEGELGVVRSV